MQDGISFCQFLSASVCIRLQKTVYLHEGKPFTAFPFSCFHTNKEAIWARMQTKSSAISFQYAPFHPAKCAILEDNLPKIVR